MFIMPIYKEPDLDSLRDLPELTVKSAPADGVAPIGFHSTSMYPEYFHWGGKWTLAQDSRMDCCVVMDNASFEVVEPRRLKKGDLVVLGRSENGEEGIFMHTAGFSGEGDVGDRFVFRTGRSRETAYSKDYDGLYELLRYEREHGNILWVMGPAVAFDYDSRSSMQALIENGFVSALLAGNALATHDLEAGLFSTALGQDIYTQKSRHNGHYNHLDVINLVREAGSIKSFLDKEKVTSGIMYALTKRGIPYVLAGSIRDDGPLPEVIGNVYEAQNAMRALVRKATTVICIATQLHTIATGNMTPSFRVVDGTVRPLFIYNVDISEFAVNKLRDRGSLCVTSIVTNAQDFIVNAACGVGVRS
jgi:lysine-ketoglutarate reductase/saccharopine dehydrogenase-like protein (TIGR00300 family)